MADNDKIIIAVPKGRILQELEPLMTAAGIIPEPAFFDDDARQLQFKTNNPGIELVRVRSFDVATFVAFGAAQLGVAGRDVLLEFDYPELLSPVDLRIGACRLSVAAPKDLIEREDPKSWSHVRVATKYPNMTRKHFAAQGIQAECIKLNGAMELAPSLGLCRRIVDLVSTGGTLRANGLVELDVITEVTSRLIVNRTAAKTRPTLINDLVQRFQEVRDAA